MSLSLSVVTPPASEPLDLTTVKNFLRVEIAEDDALINGLITTARLTAENYLRRQLITATLRYTLDSLPASLYGFPVERAIWLPRPPLQSVTSFTYLDLEGNTQTLDPSTYFVDIYSEPGRVALNPYKIWPLTQRLHANGATIVYVAGYGSSGSNVPQNIISGMLLMIGHWYSNRSAVEVGTIATEIPLGAKYCLDASDFGSYV